tara:strand:+ start:2043 stop:2186 length:144 start_codon:yes stop_codon:yes gene_type:complete
MKFLLYSFLLVILVSCENIKISETSKNENDDKIPMKVISDPAFEIKK